MEAINLTILTWAIILVAAYFIGSIPSGLIIGKAFYNTDLRQRGSGNIGATNAWRVLGKKAGFIVFLMDFLKGAIPVLLAENFIGTPWSMVIIGIMAIAGHVFSIFTAFQGGKAVATGLGVVTIMMPNVALIVFAVWLAIVMITRYVSLGSIVASVLVPVLAVLFGYPLPFMDFGVFTATLIVLRHRPNIKRLLNGTENKI